MRGVSVKYCRKVNIMVEEITDSVVEETSEQEVEEVIEDQSETESETSESESEEDIEEVEETEDDDEESEEDQDEDQSKTTSAKIEYEGKEYDVPPELKDAFMRNKDYTEKTQALSTQRQEHQAKVEDFNQYVEATQAHSENMNRLAALDMELQKFNIDWDAFYDADPTAATKADRQLRSLQEQRQYLVGEIQQSEQIRQQQIGQQKAKTAAATDAQLAKELPNWTKEHKATLGKFAVDVLGLPAKEVSNAVTPGEMKAIYYAEIGYRLMNKVKTDTKAKSKPQVKVEPTKTLKPKRQSAPKSLSNVTDPEQYRKLRMAQQRKKA